MSASVPLVTRTHWKLVLVSVRKGSGNPSTSAMVPAVAASVCPTCAVPVIPGWPVAASFTRCTKRDSVYVAALSSVPSFTLKVKLVKGIPPPFSFAGGTYFRLLNWAAGTVCGRSPDVSAMPENVSVPLSVAGSDKIFTLERLLPSASVKVKSEAKKVSSVSSFRAKFLLLEVGGLFAETAAVAALVSVSALLASSVKLTLTLTPSCPGRPPPACRCSPSPRRCSYPRRQRSGSTGTCSRGWSALRHP